MTTERYFYISGEEFVARQTRQIMREFGSSRPKPRGRKMGFKPEPKRQKLKELLG